MGCHTWFFTKVDPQPTYEQVREKLLSHYHIEMGFYQRHVSNTLAEDELFLFEDRTIESSEYAISVIQRWISRVEKRLCQVATMRHGAGTMNDTFCERDHQFYTEVGLHDVFRIGGYPNDELLSFEDTMEFFEKNDDKIFWGGAPTVIGKEATIEIIREFWNKYPNGMIHFG